MAAITLTQRRHLRVTGVVQGVGFRPFVYRIAVERGLGGFVGNDSRGVFIEAEGAPEALESFEQALRYETPPLAHVEAVSVDVIAPRGETAFSIVESQQVDAATLVSPDIAICDDCLRELFDARDRRYRYPFINCTNCGPRFTIIRDIPYDRPQTTMDAFPMCPTCAAEYHDPLNRRFHAQPNACPDCGPQLAFVAGGARREKDKALLAAEDALKRGQIVAVKGLGGFHLACDATRDEAVRRLRERKGRHDQPFAVMVSDLEQARRLAHISSEEGELLASRQRPIVLLCRRYDAGLSWLVAPDNPYLGLMLPYTPLHYLLLRDLGFPLVMTSGNLSDEPIVTDNDEAMERLAPIADAFLLHDRAIHIPCDDSVVTVEFPIRRSRGDAPLPVRLPFPARPLLAVGGELKNTFCLTRDDHAFMSQHIGDMDNLETENALNRAVRHMETLFRVQPEAVACDLHPGYRSARWAAAEAQARGIPLFRVQHHHAHIAAVMAEHRLGDGQQVIGVCLDGTGYGTDGAIWGGEVLVADYRSFTRAAHLKYVPLPGGDAAIRKPYRAALAHLWAAGIEWKSDLPPVQACSETEQHILRRQIERGINTVPTSSMGRLFDAVASLIGVRQTVTYEAQAAIQLEGCAAPLTQTPYAFGLDSTDECIGIDPAPLLRALVADWRAGSAQPLLSVWFHLAVADALVSAVLTLRERTQINVVALSGGVFQNRLLLQTLRENLAARGFEVLTHHQVPPNDGGIALGQAVIAQFQLA